MTTQKNKKIAVVLLNLGGPDSVQAIEPFLFNFFMDKNILRVPFVLRWILAKWISRRRAQNEAKKNYAYLGNKTPLYENTLKQAQALEIFLNKSGGGDFRCFIAMRYWHPMSEETAMSIKMYEPDEIILLPLYPQYSTATTRSSFQEWDKASIAVGFSCPQKKVCCYPLNKGYIKACSDYVCDVYNKCTLETGQIPRLLFSAHGLPEDIIKDGDPYQFQCEQTAQEIAEATGIHDLDWQVCYQSRVGPKKWIGPSTEEAIRKAAEEDLPIIIFPYVFTQDHVETLVEVEIEYRHFSESLGVPAFYRVPVVGVHPDFIDGLARIVLARISGSEQILPDEGKAEKLCPQTFCRCAVTK